MMTGSHTPETKARISATLKGRKRPPEVCAKIAASKRGKKQSDAHRLSQRVAQRVIKLFKPEVYEAMRARRRVTMTANMQDPAFRARIAAGKKAYYERRRAEKAAEAAKPKYRRPSRIPSPVEGLGK